MGTPPIQCFLPLFGPKKKKSCPDPATTIPIHSRICPVTFPDLHCHAVKNLPNGRNGVRPHAIQTVKEEFSGPIDHAYFQIRQVNNFQTRVFLFCKNGAENAFFTPPSFFFTDVRALPLKVVLVA